MGEHSTQNVVYIVCMGDTFEDVCWNLEDAIKQAKLICYAVVLEYNMTTHDHRYIDI